jgi:hypothetical protein
VAWIAVGWQVNFNEMKKPSAKDYQMPIFKK